MSDVFPSLRKVLKEVVDEKEGSVRMDYAFGKMFQGEEEFQELVNSDLKTIKESTCCLGNGKR